MNPPRRRRGRSALLFCEDRLQNGSDAAYHDAFDAVLLKELEYSVGAVCRHSGARS